MTASEKLQKLLNYFGTNKNKLGTLIKKRQSLYDIDSGKIKSFSGDLVTALKEVYPELNEKFFLFDDLNMLLPGSSGKEMSSKEFLSHIPEPEKKFNPTVKDVNKAIKEAKLKKEQKENAKVNEKLPIIKEVKVIPEKVALGLVSSFFDNEYVNALETEMVQVEEYFSEDAYKVDTVGESMNDGTLRSLLDGDKYLAKDIPRSKWGEKLINGGKNLFYILHAERGHLIKEIIEHNIEDKTITLHSYNPNKKLFPDFTIKTTECYIIASIQELLSRKI